MLTVGRPAEVDLLSLSLSVSLSLSPPHRKIRTASSSDPSGPSGPASPAPLSPEPTGLARASSASRSYDLQDRRRTGNMTGAEQAKYQRIPTDESEAQTLASADLDGIKSECAEGAGKLSRSRTRTCYQHDSVVWRSFYTGNRNVATS